LDTDSEPDGDGDLSKHNDGVTEVDVNNTEEVSDSDAGCSDEPGTTGGVGEFLNDNEIDSDSDNSDATTAEIDGREDDGDLNPAVVVNQLQFVCTQLRYETRGLTFPYHTIDFIDRGA
jgi:hypothetical protein